MRTAIVCKSVHHGNTLKVAEAIAEEIGADIFIPEEVDDQTLQQYDLIGFGSGIYYSKHHKSILNLVGGLSSLSEKDIFMFYTSGFDKLPVMGSFESALTEQLEKKEAHVKGLFSCRGFETWGPFRFGGGRNKGHPDASDLAEARAFAKGLSSSV